MSLTHASLAAALWLAGLWYAAALVRVRETNANESAWSNVAARVRDAGLLGVGIPLVLAAGGVLSGTLCLTTLGALIVVRTIRSPPLRRDIGRSARKRRGVASSIGLGLPSVAVVATAWPALVRPLQQGDSLGYHLPNAAAWTVTHTLWTTGTWYWWYPGGSECFAAGVFAVAGPSAVGLGGFVANLLLAHRIAAFAERAGFSAFASGAVAAAVATIPTIALQGASLENDVWLAAWLLDVLWALREEPSAVARSLAVVGLLKPYGFVFGALALVAARRVRVRDVAIGFAPIASWMVRDAVSWKSATIDPGALSVRDTFGTTILAHGAVGLTTLFDAIRHAGPGFALATAALGATLVASRDRTLRIVAFGTFVFFLVEPFGFRNDIPQLATGASLRFLVPALVVGFVGVLPLLGRLGAAAALVAVAVAVVNVETVVAIFANDAVTRGWYLAALAVGIAIASDALRTRGVATATLAAALVAYAVRLAGSHPIDYFDDGMSRGTVRSHLFAWLARTHPGAVVGSQIAGGAISMVSAHTLVTNSVDADPCAEARRARALLVLADSPPTSETDFLARRVAARRCGSVAFDDGISLVVQPAGYASSR